VPKTKSLESEKDRGKLGAEIYPKSARQQNGEVQKGDRADHRGPKEFSTKPWRWRIRSSGKAARERGKNEGLTF